MPIYEYECDACGARRELILKPGATARPNCGVCRKRMRRLISPTSFVLKGSGWYVTDYPSAARTQGLAGEKPAPAAAAEKPAADAVADKGGTKETAAAPAPAPAAAAPAGGRSKKKKP